MTLRDTSGNELTEDEIKALLWATAPYSAVPATHEASVVGHSIALIRSARAKMGRTLTEAQDA